MSLKEKSIRSAQMNQPADTGKQVTFVIADNSISTPKLKDSSVVTEKIKDKSVTPEKLSDNVYDAIVKPTADRIISMIDGNDGKYKAITDELYSMIASLQVGGIALSGKLGERTDIGIHQKALSKMIGRIWDELGNITHTTYMDFTLTVEPLTIISEGSGTVRVTADCSEAISDFDSIKIYVNNVLKAESSDVTRFTRDISIDGNSTIKAVGVIMGKTITKTNSVKKLYPFFMGGGQVYTDVMNEACQKELIGTLEGDYDATISTSGQYLFVIIPISHKEEYRRCKMDMNGFEIPFDETEMTDWIVCKSKNTYKAGTYNIDIDINT